MSNTKLETPRLLLHINEFDNLWNKIALEFARPTLHQSLPPTDMELVKKLGREIKALDPSRWPYVCRNFPELSQL